MSRAEPQPAVAAAALTRLGALNPLDAPAIAAIEAAALRTRAFPAQRGVMTAGDEIVEPLLILDGWAARIRNLPDGRRQIVNFILPGDVVGLYDHRHPVAPLAVTALTPLLLCRAPERGVSAALDEAYAVARALDEARLFEQVTRLGRLTAYERIADLFLELVERLTLAGLAHEDRCPMPLTQEVIAEALGLTSVHVNRMLQQARRTGDLTWQARELVLLRPQALRSLAGRLPVRVSAP